jgi:hypothetical protein
VIPFRRMSVDASLCPAAQILTARRGSDDAAATGTWDDGGI